MELKRRRFFQTVAAAVAAAAGWTTRPARWVEAVRSRIYPGPTKPFNRADVRRTGPWAG